MGQEQSSQDVPPEVKAAEDLYGDSGSESEAEDGKVETPASASASSHLAVPSDGGGGGGLFDRKKTFRAKKKYKKGSKLGTLHESMKASMKATLGGQGDMRKTVQLPDGEDLNEWFAVNTVHFFNAASMVYGTCSDFCTAESCAVMSAGPKYEYLWADGVKVKKPIKVSAPEYMTLLFEWVDEQISNPEVFPVDENAKFPRNFQSIIKNIYKRLFRLYGHIYYSHFEKIQSIGAEAHLNTCFKHFIYFIDEFDLVDKKELAPLQRLIDKLIPEKAGQVPAETS
jgi:MOB kinase activator 1